VPRGDEKLELIRSVPLFAQCGGRELEEVAAAADLIDVPAGLTLVTQGQHTNEFVVIAQGACEVTRDGAPVATLGPGEFFGEIALFTGAPRTATVTATEPSTLLVLTDRAFGRVAEDIPSILASVLTVLAERLLPGSL
jgi:CRP/FNR family transcriptional regulator, cyclic AMP receptor protein